MTPESDRISASDRSGQPRARQCPTRRGVLLGAGLAGLGGALAGCSTAAVPYDANEAGVVNQNGAATSGAMAGSGGMAGSPAPAGTAEGRQPAKRAKRPRAAGLVLGAASEIPVGGGKIYTAAKVVVTQPVRGQYRAFSAVCTHVGCIMSAVANGTIDCPCHGSQFKITNGAVVTGPAPSPLPPEKIKIVNGMVVLV